MISPETLRRFPLFAGTAPAQFKELAMLGEEVAFNTGDWLFYEGDAADALYLILSGSIELKIRLDAAGTHHADLNTLIEGEVVGWSALVEPYVYTLGAVAISDAQLVKLDGEKLRKLLAQNPELGFSLMSRLAQAIGRRLTNLRVQFVSLAGV